MNRLIAIACVTAIGLAGAPAAMAQQGGPRPQQQCQNGRDGNGAPCRAEPQNGRQQGQNQPGKGPQGQGQKPGQHQAQNHRSPQADNRAPHIGDRARNAKPFRQAQNSRLPRLPRWQEYRVVDNHLVRIDSDTLKIVAVIGLLDALMR